MRSGSNSTGKARKNQALTLTRRSIRALCFGWIDSAIRKIDAVRYARRFTPRRPGSSWSKSNVQKAEALVAQGRMTEYGAAVFRKRTVKT